MVKFAYYIKLLSHLTTSFLYGFSPVLGKLNKFAHYLEYIYQFLLLSFYPFI